MPVHEPHEDAAFEKIVDQVPGPERAEMVASAERVAGLLELRERVMALHGRPLFADEHPEALQELVDPTIELRDEKSWGLPAGWVGIVNRLHADLVELLGDYVITEIGQKSGGLRLYTSPVARDEVHERIRAAREESLRTCEVCGEPDSGQRPRFTTRCDRHAFTGTTRIPGAVARPPGWAPDERE